MPGLAASWFTFSDISQTQGYPRCLKIDASHLATKAIDTVNYVRFVNKQKLYGIRGIVLGPTDTNP